MLKIVGVSDGKYSVLDTDDGVVDTATIEELYVYRATGIYIEGCHFTRDGLIVDMDGVLCPRGSVEVPEVWRPVVQFNVQEKNGRWRYEVSNKGKVRSWYTGGCVLLTSTKSKQGYLFACLSVNGVSKSFPVHRLVSMAYIVNERGADTVNHLDECKSNNCVENLEWCTRRENVLYGTGIERRAVSRSRWLRMYSLDGGVQEFLSARKAAEAIGVSRGAVSAALNGYSTFCNEFLFRHVNNDELYELSIDRRRDIITKLFESREDVRRTRLSEALADGVRQYDINGYLIKEYTSIRNAAIECGFSKRDIQACCYGTYRFAFGFVWRRMKCDELFDMTELERKAIFDSYDMRTVVNRGRPVRQYSFTGELVKEYSSLSEAARGAGLRVGNIGACVRRVVKFCGGYIWRYADDDVDVKDGSCLPVVHKNGAVEWADGRECKAVRQYTLDGVFVKEFSSHFELSDFDLEPSLVFSVARRQKNYSKSQGYIWRFIDDDEFADLPENVELIRAFHEQQKG